MKCPKCDYLGFETGDRCRNCGYDFSLITGSAGPAVDSSLDLPPRSPRGTASASRTEQPLPLFKPPAEHDDEPLIVVPAVPRPPLAVRKTPPSPRPRALSKSRPRVHAADEQVLRFVEDGPARGWDDTPWADGGEVSARTEHAAAAASPAGRRVSAAVVDQVILLCIDALVLYFTLRIAELPLGEWRRIPPVPLMAFLVLVKTSYFLALTALGGQTIGKMVFGIRVVAEGEGSIDALRATRRTVAGLVSILSFGLGFLPALLGSERRAFHDRVAGTRVVSLRSV